MPARRRQAQPGLERAVPADHLQVEGEEEDDAHQRERNQRDGGGRRGQLLVAEERDVQRRVRGAQLDQHEYGQQREAAEDRASTSGLVPGVCPGAADDPVDEQHQPGDRRSTPSGRCGRPRVLSIRHQEKGQHQPTATTGTFIRRPNPTRKCRAEAAGYRADRDGGPLKPAQMPIALPARPVEDVRDDRQVCGITRRRRCHQAPAGDQLAGGLREGGERRGEDEAQKAGEPHPLAAEAVAEHSPGEEQARRRPARTRSPPTDVACEERGPAEWSWRDVEDRVVEDHHQQGDHRTPRIHQRRACTVSSSTARR